VRSLKGELPTVVFLIGYGIIVAGVARVSTTAAYVLAGLVLCVGAALVAVRNERERERRRRDRAENR
jgi:hypothetical protein